MATPQSSTSTQDSDSTSSRAEREKAFYNEKDATSYHTVRAWIWRALGEFRRDRKSVV